MIRVIRDNRIYSFCPYKHRNILTSLLRSFDIINDLVTGAFINIKDIEKFLIKNYPMSAYKHGIKEKEKNEHS